MPMATDPKSRPSFSAASRFRIGLDVVLRTALVLAVAGMVNFLGAKLHHRFYWSAQTRVELASSTLTILHSLTNRVEVTLYYDTRNRENFYPSNAPGRPLPNAARRTAAVAFAASMRATGRAAM